MRLSELILAQADTVADRWYGLVLEAYPPETVRLWTSKKDSFANPVGSTYRMALAKLLPALVQWQDAAAVAAPLEDIIKIRAIQEMAPGKALAFVLGLKKLLREVFSKEIEAHGLADELAMYDARVDNLALMAFDIYTKSREAVFEMRVQEFKNAHHMAFRKAGIVCESPRRALGLEEINPKPGQAR